MHEKDGNRRVSPGLAALRGRDEDTPAHVRATQAYAAGEISWDEVERITRESERASDRARRARREGRRAPDPRADRPPPRPSDQWAQPMDTTAARDRRLTPSARVLAQIVVAEVGNRGARLLSNRYLARVLGLSPRHVRRLVSDLARYGYVVARVVASPSGKTLGRSLSPAPCLRPFWHPARRACGGRSGGAEDARSGPSPVFGGRTSASPNNTPEGCKDQAHPRLGDVVAAVVRRGGRSPGYDPG